MAATEEPFSAAANALGGDEFGDLAEGVEGGDEFGEEGEVQEAGPTTGPTSEDPFKILNKYHPETIIRYAEAILPEIPLRAAPPDQDGQKDSLHQSPPFLTVYERTKILGTRTNQLADGARPFITVPDYITQPLEIAKLELEARVLPFVIERPMPDGSFEYWRLSDLMIL